MALDPELHAILSEGQDAAAYTPFVDKPKIPDYEHLRRTKWARYFPQFTGKPYSPQEHPFPAWFYHPTQKPILIADQFSSEEPPQLMKKAKDIALDYGIQYRQSSQAELINGFPPYRWAYADNCKWRHIPYEDADSVANPTKFNPERVPSSKTVVYPQQRNQGMAADQIAAIVSAVAAQFEARQAKEGRLSVAMDPEYQDFQVFKQWMAENKKTDPKVAEVVSILEPNAPGLSSKEEKQVLIEAAEERGIKVDKRWNVDTLKAELDKFSA